jgi:acyl-CoA reductase-like NAD-dependent aldehyde dehydrogenase
MVSPQPFARLVAAEIDGRAHNIRYRQSQFHRLQSALVQHIDQIRNALQTDSGNVPEEVQAEICLALKEIRTHYLSLNMQEDLENEYRVTRGKDNQDAARGSGIVYIIPATHTMFFSVISALSAAIAAGNCIILEVRTDWFMVLSGADGCDVVDEEYHGSASAPSPDSASGLGRGYICD